MARTKRAFCALTLGLLSVLLSLSPQASGEDSFSLPCWNPERPSESSNACGIGLGLCSDLKEFLKKSVDDYVVTKTRAAYQQKIDIDLSVGPSAGNQSKATQLERKPWRPSDSPGQSKPEDAFVKVTLDGALLGRFEQNGTYFGAAESRMKIGSFYSALSCSASSVKSQIESGQLSVPTACAGIAEDLNRLATRTQVSEERLLATGTTVKNSCHQRAMTETPEAFRKKIAARNISFCDPAVAATADPEELRLVETACHFQAVQKNINFATARLARCIVAERSTQQYQAAYAGGDTSVFQKDVIEPVAQSCSAEVGRIAKQDCKKRIGYSRSCIKRVVESKGQSCYEAEFVRRFKQFVESNIRSPLGCPTESQDPTFAWIGGIIALLARRTQRRALNVLPALISGLVLGACSSGGVPEIVFPDTSAGGAFCETLAGEFSSQSGCCDKNRQAIIPAPPGCGSQLGGNDPVHEGDAAIPLIKNSARELALIEDRISENNPTAKLASGSALTNAATASSSGGKIIPSVVPQKLTSLEPAPFVRSGGGDRNSGNGSGPSPSDGLFGSDSITETSPLNRDMSSESAPNSALVEDSASVYAAGGSASGGERNADSAASLKDLFAAGDATDGRGLASTEVTESTFGNAFESQPRASYDPLDYFGLINEHESLFKRVSVRYRLKTERWLIDRSREALRN